MRVPTNRELWEQAFDTAQLRDADFTTMSGIPLEPVYGPDDGEFPGVYPYTRGPYASMYRSKLWTMRMFAGFGTADDTNWRFKEIIKSGGDGLSTAFDMPTLLGIDSDDPMALGEVGRCGVAIDSLADMEDLYAGIDLGTTTTSMTINSPAAVIFAMYVAQAEKAGVAAAQLGGTLQNDILKEYQAQKEFVFPPRPSMRLVRDTIAVHRRGDAALALDLDLRLPHPRGRLDRRRGAGVHARQRVRLRRAGDAGRPAGRRVRAAAVVLLQRPHRLLRGDRQVPRRPADLGALDARALRRQAASGRCSCASTPRPPACR